MSITLAVGTQVQIATGYAAVKAMSALSNANPGVATLAASHGIIVGDYFEITSGWGRADGRIARASAVATIEGLDTSSTARYPAGTGTGSVREITGWTTITQITEDGLQVSGGGQQYSNTTTLDDVVSKKIPTTRDAIDISLKLFYDASLAWWATVMAASDSATPTALRLVFPNGAKLVANAYWSLQQVPTIEDKTLRTAIDLSFSAAPITYTT
jgi:Phage tail tube protein, TTP